MPTQDPKKMLKDLAAELLKVNKELDKTKDGAGSGKKRGAKELETGALTTILDSLSRSLDLVKTMLEKGNQENCLASRPWRTRPGRWRIKTTASIRSH